MEVINMRKGSWGKVRAFFDLKTSEGIVIKGFKIVEGDWLFVGFPSAKGKDGEYYPTISADKDLKNELNQLANSVYDKIHTSNDDVPF